MVLWRVGHDWMTFTQDDKAKEKSRGSHTNNLIFCSEATHTVVCWSQFIWLHKSQLCTALPNSTFIAIKLVARNQPWQEYLHQRNKLVLQITLLLSPTTKRTSCSVATNTFLDSLNFHSQPIIQNYSHGSIQIQRNWEVQSYHLPHMQTARSIWWATVFPTSG